MGALAPLRIVGPRPTARPYGLVTTPGTIVSQDDLVHYLGGVAVDSYPADLPSTHNPCATGTSRVKDVGSDPPRPEFSSFTVYLPVDCSGLGIGNMAGAELLRNRARETFEAVETYGVERELAFADVDAADRPHLTGLEVADYLNGGAATGPIEALALLEQSLGQTAREGFIHADPGTGAIWTAHNLIVPAGGTMRTVVKGTTVIIGDGYIGAQPDAQGRDADPLNDDQNWAFATGPVRVSRDELFVPTLREVFDHVTNGVSFKVERNYVAYWDTALLKGVNVDRSTTP
jgi:hypothetical protein